VADEERAMNAEREHEQRRIAPTDRQWWLRSAMPIGARHPAAVWLSHTLPGSVDTAATCPRCPFEGHVPATLDHLLGHHASGFGEAAQWLETVDGDLFSLAVHYLASQAGTAATG
jgi:hypothetical protein